MYSEVFTLSDGRRLGFSEYGHPDGPPLIMLHGAPGSRLEHFPEQGMAPDQNFRLIVPDRPGYGESDPAPGRSLLSWAHDLNDLMDHLDLPACPLLGFSSGGPFAMACAVNIPERVTRLGLASSLAPPNVPHITDGMNEQSKALFALARSDPAMFAAQIEAMVTSGEVLYQIMTAGLPVQDACIFSRPGMADMYAADMGEAVKQGVSGIVEDMILLSRDWGFSPQDIRCDTHLWQGLDDINVPPIMGKHLAEAIPGCRATLVPDAGHFLLFTHWRDMLTTISE